VGHHLNYVDRIGCITRFLQNPGSSWSEGWRGRDASVEWSIVKLSGKSLVWRSAGLFAVAAVLIVALVALSSTPPRPVSGASTKTPHLGNPSPGANSVIPFGDASVGPTTVTGVNAPIVGLAATPDGKGYWLVAADGGIFTFGDAGFYGSTGGIRLNQPIVGMAATPDGKGYWLVASDGGIFTFGDAGFYGSTGAMPLNEPIVGLAATPDGKGYWLVAADGGIFTFGDAGFYGSTGGIHLNQPIVGLAATPDGKGYTLVAADGGIFTFGDAGFYGSTGAMSLNAPIVGLAATPDGKGYWLAAADGGVFTFGDATYAGSEGGVQLSAPVVGLAATPDGKGYWLAFGSNQRPLAGKVVGIDPGHNGLNYTAPQIINQPVFNGQENEACDTTGTATDGGYTEAEYNFNVATYLQADLVAEGADVVMTRTDNAGVGPCVTTRAAILNNGHADVAVDIHADGGPAAGRGFTVLEPVADGPNDAVIASSLAFATVLRNTFGADTGMPLSTYDGVDGLQPRDDLAGLNLTTVPKVLIETGNMRNATDAALLVTAAFQHSAAEAMAQAITIYLTGHPIPAS
jgi:N-acetylmuramoyl-L-alanine amidase